MQEYEVEIGAVYRAKVNDKIARVRIDHAHGQGGWAGTNLDTGRSVHIKSAKRLQERIEAPEPPASESPSDQNASAGDSDKDQDNAHRRRAKKKISKKERDRLRSESQADQENARTRDERDAASDDLTASERAMTESESENAKNTGKKMTCLDAAAHVLEQADTPLTCSEMIDRIFEQQLWSTNGKTPAATLYSAIAREIQKKGKEARFVLAERGRFALNR